ncbi:putative shikimate dehydrogenase substrate binding domain-containing protein [Magnetofaba australis IT-1]|uniref:shikimate dehydrogenase (NADP(+)) n=1 Tax=Magnetofaba australis IT-1 TaxID=1434232 RepID=A0A1Y2K1I0_9PROT|nr:putative shikimate dehydrogenase substrate binding domain-containing protein [Magnetofaba australis IT-1]
MSDFLDNSVDLPAGRPYGAIMGLAPSKGARSPILWRAAFDALGMQADFHPFDVTPENLPGLVKALKADARYLGGAVAVPHKELLLTELDRIDEAARAIGAVNAIRRDPDGALVGANTDGLAAVESFEATAGPVRGKKLLLLGLGGAGKAVAACFALAGAELMVWNRDGAKAREFAGVYSASGKPVRAVSDIASVIAEADALINCTSVGFAADSSDNDDAPLDLALLDQLPAHAAVFDIIYQPLQTALLRAAAARGLKTLNGKSMNLGQAVIAFALALPDADRDKAAAAMAAV